jgi:hypothetical protein
MTGRTPERSPTAPLVMLFAPKGLWDYVGERYGITLFPTRRHLTIAQ